MKFLILNRESIEIAWEVGICKMVLFCNDSSDVRSRNDKFCCAITHRLGTKPTLQSITLQGDNHA